MTIYTKGIDTSTHQDDYRTAKRIDWTLPKLQNIRFVINRACYVTSNTGACLKDDDFDYNYEQQRINSYIRGAYGFWGYWDGCVSVVTQAKTYINILKSNLPEFPVAWLDVEKANSQYPTLPHRSITLPAIERWMKTAEDGLGFTAGIYTNISGLMVLHPIPDWLQEKPLWIAWPLSPSTGETTEDFITRTGVKPPISKYWKNPFTLFQYSWKGAGFAAGMESAGLDMNYFNGSEQELLKFCNLTEISNPNPDPDPGDEDNNDDDNGENGDEIMLKMRVLADILNVRTGPGLSYGVVRRIPKNTEITIYDVAGISGAWVQISPDKNEWVCVQNSTGLYLQKIDQ